MIYNTKELKEFLTELMPTADDVYECVLISQMQFKTKRIFEEFAQPCHSSMLNSRLLALIWYSAGFFESILRIPIVLTGLIRTQAEQNIIYEDNEAYQKKPWKSVHQFGRGCDVRIRGIQSAYVNKFVVHINKSFPYRPVNNANYDKGHPTALLEKDHIHLQVREG